MNILNASVKKKEEKHMGYSHDVYQTIIEQKLNHNSQNRPKSWAQLLSK